MQIINKNLRLQKVYIFFISFVLFIIIFSTTYLHANSFRVSDIEISSPFELNFKKNSVIDKGFQISFLNLLSMITTSSDKTQIKDILLDADQIEFGPELAAITTEEEVPEEQKRYGIETQTNELLDDLLSSIPNTERTRSVLNNIHIMIERFKQLRESFSHFDEFGNVKGKLVKESNYKPLLAYFRDFKQNLYWILPIVKNVKKIYGTEIDTESYGDVIHIELEADTAKINEIIEN